MHKSIKFLSLCFLLSCKTKSDNQNSTTISKSVSVRYYDKGDTAIKHIMTFNKFAQMDGPYVRFYTSGTVKSIEYYKEGILNGEAFYFYDNGKLSYKVNYENGKKQGKSYSFYHSGKKNNEIVWKRDIQVDYSLIYFDSTENLQYLLYYNDSGQVWYKREYDQNHNIINEEGKGKLKSINLHPDF